MLAKAPPGPRLSWTQSSRSGLRKSGTRSRTTVLRVVSATGFHLHHKSLKIAWRFRNVMHPAGSGAPATSGTRHIAPAERRSIPGALERPLATRGAHGWATFFVLRRAGLITKVRIVSPSHGPPGT